jgi:hypothetical protein
MHEMIKGICLYHLIKGAVKVGLVIIFALVTLLAAYGAFSSLKNKNFLGLFFAVGTLAIFGFFTVMTVIHHGYPAAH